MIILCLKENESLEELSLAGNVNQQEQYQTIENDTAAKKNSEALNIDNKLEDPANEQHGEDGFIQLEVADSYDNDSRIEEGSEARLADTCNSQEGRRYVFQSDNLCIKELSAAISNAKYLQLLDLSDNGFPTQIADTFYNAWCSCTRAGTPRRHVNGQLLHLSTHDKICCGVKPCCRKN